MIWQPRSPSAARRNEAVSLATRAAPRRPASATRGASGSRPAHARPAERSPKNLSEKKKKTSTKHGRPLPESRLFTPLLSTSGDGSMTSPVRFIPDGAAMAPVPNTTRCAGGRQDEALQFHCVFFFHCRRSEASRTARFSPPEIAWRLRQPRQ